MSDTSGTSSTSGAPSTTSSGQTVPTTIPSVPTPTPSTSTPSTPTPNTTSPSTTSPSTTPTTPSTSGTPSTGIADEVKSDGAEVQTVVAQAKSDEELVVKQVEEAKAEFDDRVGRIETIINKAENKIHYWHNAIFNGAGHGGVLTEWENSAAGEAFIRIFGGKKVANGNTDTKPEDTQPTNK